MGNSHSRLVQNWDLLLPTHVILAMTSLEKQCESVGLMEDGAIVYPFAEVCSNPLSLSLSLSLSLAYIHFS